MSDILHIGPDIAVLTKTGAVVTASGLNPFTFGGDAHSHTGEITTPAKYGGEEIARWGANNLYPLWLLELLRDSNINAQLIYTKVSLAMGDIFTYKWAEDPDTGEEVKKPFIAPIELRRYMRSQKVREMFRARATDFYITGNAWVKVLLRRDATGIADFQHMDASTMRLGIRDVETKKITTHYASADWRHASYNSGEPKETTIRKYPSWDESDPLAYFQSVKHSKLYWTGQHYYGVQPWHASHAWITYGNRMPVWMAANLNKAKNIKYHIEYPSNYFAYLEGKSEEERKKAKDSVFEHIDKMLSGAENAQSTFYSGFANDPMSGAKMDGWKITSIPNDLKDEAYVKAFYASLNASTSSQGVDPALANIQQEGRMPISGSDKRISYQIHEVMKNAEVREVMLEPLYLLRDVNGYDPDMMFDFRVKNIVTLAEDKGGITPNVSPSDLDL